MTYEAKLWDSATTEHSSAVDNVGFGPASLQQFDVSLDNFTGPFDLLLRLIARKQMDLTEIALASVTDEFLGFIRREPDLSSATDFLVVVATLLHMKAASLLPSSARDEPLDEDLEARDLLFARLLQYKALQQASGVLRQRWVSHHGAVARSVPLQEPYSSWLPELQWTLDPETLAVIAADALAEKPSPDEAQHVARPGASFDEELLLITNMLRAAGTTTFEQLLENASNSAVVVTRFLALLQLYREGSLTFHQGNPLATLEVQWVGWEGTGNEQR